jgi:hypothetical protein
MPYFGIPIRNGLPIGLGSVAGFGVQQFSPADLFSAGEQGAWYDPSDFSTLFTDSAGTTPVTGVEQFVGLMLDKSKGLVLGSELVDTMNTAAAWTGYGTNTVVNEDGGIKVTYVDNVSGAYTFFSAASGLAQNLTVGAQYVVTGEARVNAGSSVNIQVNAPGPTVYKTVTSTTYEQFSFRFIASDPTSNLLATAGMGAGEVIWLRNFSVKQVAGNHATQTTSAKRPKLAARYNLLTYTEQFDNNGVWLKTAASITANTPATTDPLGGNTADAFVENSATSAHAIEVSGGVAVSAISYVFSIYAKYNGRVLQLATNLPGSNVYANFDLQNGTLGSASGVTSAISSVGNGWYRCSVTVTAVAGTRNVYPCTVTTTTSGYVASYTGNGVDGVYLWGADLRPASQATGLIGPTYQRVVDAATYDTAGFLPYLAFDGLSWSMSTGSIDFSAGDKMTVWAGVRKLSDSLAGLVAELSADGVANNGTFIVGAPGAASGSPGPNYGFYSKGTSFVFAEPSTFPAPITSVVAGISNISGPAVTLRVNGVQAATNTSSQGTGNYGNYPLFIGARNNAGSFFNGWMYSLTVRGAQSSASEISAMESWVAGKTGVSL